MSAFVPVLPAPGDRSPGEEPPGSLLEQGPAPPQWLVIALPGDSQDSQGSHLLHCTMDLAEARIARGEAQLLLRLWLPEQEWVVALYTLAEGR